jgi:serine protease Do
MLVGTLAGCLAAMSVHAAGATKAPMPADPGATAHTAELSASARDLLARMRPSIVQIRSFFGGNSAEAEHGTGFAVARDGLLLTNYHVVADGILYPESYRMEYRTADGQTGGIAVLAIDVRHDLAVVRAAGFDAAPLTLRTGIPPRGERAYSLGYPLDLGLVITEGVSNGLMPDTVEPHLYYSGALNPGVSGGPTVDAAGQVIGVNAFGGGGELLNFLQPIEFAAPLLLEALKPGSHEAFRRVAAAQVQAHTRTILDSIAGPWATQNFSGYVVPAKLSGFFTCNAGGNTNRQEVVHSQEMRCQTRARLYLDEGLSSGDVSFQHYYMATDKLGALRFARRLGRTVAGNSSHTYGSPRHLTPYACHIDNVTLRSFDALVRVCARGYRKIPDLYDFSVSVASINQPGRAVISYLTVLGVEYSAATDFIKKYLETIEWNP